MMTQTILRNRGLRVIGLVAVLVAAVAAGLRLSGPASVRTTPMSRIPSILVVPLSVSGNGTDPWSGPGLAEQIRVALAASGAVRVRRSEPSTVSSPVGASDSTAAAIHARRAGADYVIIGTVGRNAAKSEIGLRLVRASDATTAWNGTFWRSSADLSSFAADLAAAVTEAVTTERMKQARSQ